MATTISLHEMLTEMERSALHGDSSGLLELINRIRVAGGETPYADISEVPWNGPEDDKRAEEALAHVLALVGRAKAVDPDGPVVFALDN
ncbi:hypothetical protein [Streptomyces wuyuanensis]|uniref:hypothetical protein n=1 Tax=Streptomyces wuyuanensis TaxID=1196353 RepID=UPI003424D9DB